MARSDFAANKGFGRRVGTSAPAFAAVPAPPPMQPKKIAGAYIEHPAVQSVLMEFEQCAAVICVILSVINRPNPTAVVTFSLREYQLPNPALYKNLRHMMQDCGLPSVALSALDNFHGAFLAAMPDIKEITSDMPNGFDHKWINDALYRLKEAAQDAYQIVEAVGLPPKVSAAAGDRRLAPARELGPMIEDVVSGGAPCWVRGRPELPEWHLRRNSVRQTLNASAVLTHNSNSHNVIVTDISRHGFGVSLVPRCDVGNDVSVVLETGRKLVGKVRWRKPDRMGVELAAPLAMNDPVIAA